MAAIPHLVGILCGHVYHFFTVVHPLMGAKRRLGAPAWMKRRLDGGDNPNFMESPGDGGSILLLDCKAFLLLNQNILCFLETPVNAGDFFVVFVVAG